MRRHSCIWLLAIAVGLVSLTSAARAQDAVAEKIAGTWTGKWASDDGATGGFELTVEKGKDALTGRVSVTGEPAYKTTAKSVKADGGKIEVRYDFPEDNRIEIVIALAVEGTKASGTWSARDAGGNSVAAGTVTLAKQ